MHPGFVICGAPIFGGPAVPIFRPAKGTVMKTFTVTVPMRKPRNPYVAASLRRKCGAHGTSGAARRQRGKTLLRREIDRLAAIEPSP